MNSLLENLQNILETMDVPEMRKTDIRWLSRNLGIRNSNHPNFQDAMNLIKELLKGIERN